MTTTATAQHHQDEHGSAETAKSTSNNKNSSNDNCYLAPFNPTCQHAQAVALDMFNLCNRDVLFDLGCGDGLLLIAAVQKCGTTHDLKCVGIEMDSTLVERAKASVEQHGYQDCIDIRHGNVLDDAVTDPPSLTNKNESNNAKQLSHLSLVKDATAVFLYLLPKGLQKVVPLLEQAIASKKPLKVVSYMFAIPGWIPTKVDRTTKGECPIYFYYNDTAEEKEDCS